MKGLGSRSSGSSEAAYPRDFAFVGENFREDLDTRREPSSQGPKFLNHEVEWHRLISSDKFAKCSPSLADPASLTMPGPVENERGL